MSRVPSELNKSGNGNGNGTPAPEKPQQNVPATEVAINIPVPPTAEVKKEMTDQFHSGHQESN